MMPPASVPRVTAQCLQQQQQQQQVVSESHMYVASLVSS